MKIASFDIFDTILQLSCGNEEQLFRILGYNILGDTATLMDICEFIRIRKNGYLEARHKTSHEEITTKQIYDQCDFSAITKVSNELIMQNEFLLIKQTLMPIWKNVQKVQELRRKNYQIFFISDMHLPSTVLLECLNKWNIINEEQDKLYVSSNILKTKHNGTLYTHIQKEQKEKIHKWIHFGDNYISDYKEARSKGIKAQIIKKTSNLHYTSKAVNNEQNYIERPLALTSAIIQSYCSSIPINQYNLLISDVIAPLYISSVYTILQNAHHKKINRLLFFARDSYMFYVIAKEFNHLFPEIQLKYIYVSRRTLYLPAIQDISLTSFLQLKDVKNLSASEYLDQFGINIDELNISIKSPNTTKETLQLIFSNPQNIKLIQAKKEKASSYLLSYLQQEIDDFSHTAMVDMTGSRSSQEALNKFLSRQNLHPISAYYFLVSEDRKSIKEAGGFMAILLSDFMNYGSFHCIGDLTLLFEDVFSITNQNRTIGYQKQDNKIVPIFDEEDKMLQSEIMEHNIQTFKKITQMYVLNKAYICNNEILKSSIYNIGKFAINPYYDYVKVLKDFSITENSSNIRKIILHPWNKDFKKAWFRGSIAALFPYSNLLISFVIFLKSLKDKIRL